jgi:hypothetical protein
MDRIIGCGPEALGKCSSCDGGLVKFTEFESSSWSESAGESPAPGSATRRDTDTGGPGERNQESKPVTVGGGRELE